MISFKTLTIAAAFSSVIFAMPTLGQATPPVVPVTIDAASNGNLVQVHSRRYCRTAAVPGTPIPRTPSVELPLFALLRLLPAPLRR